MSELPRRGSYFGPTQMVVFAITLALLLLPGATTASPISIRACCILLLLHSVWALWSWRRVSGAFFDPYLLFLLSATLFNAGLALLEVFGLNTESLFTDFPPTIIVKSLLLVLAGLAGLHFGAVLAFSPKEGSERQPPDSYFALRITGWTLLAASLGPLWAQLREVVSLVSVGGYMALYQQDLAAAGVASATGAAAELVLPGAFFVLAGSVQRRFERMAALAVLSGYCGTLLFAGYRGHSILPLVSAAWLWDCVIGRIPRAVILAAAAVLVSFVFPLVRATRDLPAAERTVSTEAYSELGDRSAVSGLSEMGGSLATVAYTIELVPAQRPYDLGMGYAYALLTIIPSVFWDRHPSVARGTPSAWLIETVDPITASLGGGLGFSFIADAYLNFGAFGVPLISLLMGFGIVRFSRWASGSAARLAVVATFLPFLLFSARSEIANLPRPLVWYSFAPYALYFFFRRLLEKLSSRRWSGRALGSRPQQSSLVWKS